LLVISTAASRISSAKIEATAILNGEAHATTRPLALPPISEDAAQKGTSDSENCDDAHHQTGNVFLDWIGAHQKGGKPGSH
jgi:hypothetical protein